MRGSLFFLSLSVFLIGCTGFQAEQTTLATSLKSSSTPFPTPSPGTSPSPTPTPGSTPTPTPTPSSTPAPTAGPSNFSSQIIAIPGQPAGASVYIPSSGSGINTMLLSDYMNGLEGLCTECPDHVAPLSLEQVSQTLTTTQGSSLNHFREIIETSRYFPTPGYVANLSPMIAILQLYQAQGATVVLTMGAPIPGWMNPDTSGQALSLYPGMPNSCIIPSSATSWNGLINNFSASIALMAQDLWTSGQLDTNWLAHHLLIEPFNEMDALPLGPGCSPLSSLTTAAEVNAWVTDRGTRAAQLTTGIQNALAAKSLPFVVTTPSGATGNVLYFQSFYAAGGMAMPNAHYYYGDSDPSDPAMVENYIDTVTAFLTQLNASLPSSYQNNIILGEFGLNTPSTLCNSTTSCAGSEVSGAAEQQFMLKFLRNPQLQALAPVRMMWQMMDDTQVYDAADIFTYGVFTLQMTPKVDLFEYLLAVDGINIAFDTTRLPDLRSQIQTALAGAGYPNPSTADIGAVMENVIFTGESVSQAAATYAFPQTSGNAALNAFLQTLYTGLLNRPADDGGLSTWTTQFAAGTSCAAIAQGFLSSEEFSPVRDAVTADGGATTADINRYLDQVYQGLLGRSPDPTGYQYWFGQLQSGEGTPAVLETSFLTSSEFTGRCSAL